MPANKRKGNQLPIVVFGDSEAEATSLYGAVATGDGVVSLSNGEDSILTHESLSEEMYNPHTGQIDLKLDADMTAEASAQTNRTGTVDVFSAECSDGCGKHIISDTLLQFCPACSSDLPADDSEEDVDLVDLESEEEFDGEDSEEESEEEFDGEDSEEFESESGESMIVVAGDTFEDAVRQFVEVATNRSQRIFASESGNFVSHSSSEANCDPITGETAEEIEGNVELSSESGEHAEYEEAEHLQCVDCNAHNISTSSSIVSCIRCGGALLDSHSADDEDLDAEMEALSAEIDELESELDLADDESFEDEDEEFDDVDMSSESSDDEFEDIDSLLAEASEMLESDSSDDLDEDLEDYNPDEEEDLTSDDILESESFASGDGFGSESSDDEDDLDLDALDEELNALESDDEFESESQDVQFDDDLIELLSESSDEDEEEFDEEDSEEEFDDADSEESEESEEDDSEIEGLDIEDSLEDDEDLASESLDTLEVDLLQAIAASEDLDVTKLHVAHCGSIEGQSTWTAFYGKIPVAMCSESNVREVEALRNIFETPRFGDAIKAHAAAEGIDDALTQFKFERINPNIDVDAVVADQLVQRCEARVEEANVALATALESMEQERAADQEQRLDRTFDALSASALGINRGVFQNISNPIANRLITALSAAGMSPAQASTLVNNAFVESGDDYAEQLLGQARTLVAKPAEVQQAVIDQIVATANNRTVAQTVVIAEPVAKQMQSESAAKPQNSFLAILNG